MKMNCRKIYVLTKEQELASKKIVDVIQAKFKKYENIVCETTFDAGVYFEPQEELLELECDE
jgi:hypothetical protein